MRKKGLEVVFIFFFPLQWLEVLLSSLGEGVMFVHIEEGGSSVQRSSFSSFHSEKCYRTCWAPGCLSDYEGMFSRGVELVSGLWYNKYVCWFLLLLLI